MVGILRQATVFIGRDSSDVEDHDIPDHLSILDMKFTQAAPHID